MATGTEPTADRQLGDLYAVLGLRPDASRQEIEAAYRRAALETGYDDEAWRAVREAYEVLQDPERRARHDTTRDGFRAAREPAKKSRNPIDRLFPGLPHGWRVALDWVVTIAGAVAIVLAIKAWVVNPYRIPSSSMEPTLHCARPEQGCEASTSDRVLGLPGEAWSERDGYVYINGARLDEAYIHADRRDTQTLSLTDLPPKGALTHIPKDEYLMMGDNRASSCDSRVWGLVPRKNLIGEVFATYWPPSRISFH